MCIRDRIQPTDEDSPYMTPGASKNSNYYFGVCGPILQPQYQALGHKDDKGKDIRRPFHGTSYS